MATSNEDRNSAPVWWTVEHTVIWEQSLPSLRSDFEDRAAEHNRNQIKQQGADDSVFQSGQANPRNVDVEHAHAVSDEDWELGADWNQIEPAMRYGVGARAQYPDYNGWSDELETRLRADWNETNEPSSWDKLKRAVRRGFEFVYRKPS